MNDEQDTQSADESPETPTEMLSRLRLIASGERECDLSDNDAKALAWLINCHLPLYGVASTVVAVCESGNENLAQLACMETSPLVDEARAAIAKVKAGYTEVKPVTDRADGHGTSEPEQAEEKIEV